MFRVFPATLSPDGRKIPLIKEWQQKATDDPKQIRLWSELFRDRIKFWGIPTGSPNGIIALDVDVKNGGLETIKNYQVPNTKKQRTLNGGVHYIFKLPQDNHRYGNRVNFQPGLDIRGEGGWIAYYGTDNEPIADPPEWFIQQALRPETYEIQEGNEVKVAPEIAEKIIREALENIREAPSGQANETLNLEAFKVGRLVRSGSISEQYARAELIEAAKYRGKSIDEATATINSGFKGANSKPLTSPFGQPIPHIAIPEVPVEERWTPTFFSLFNLTDTTRLRKPQLFENWSTEDIHLTTADGGTGKTTLKLYEAVCLALGESFLGFKCLQPGKTLFITGEDSQEKLGAIIGAICKQMGIMENTEKMNKVLSSIVVKKDSDFCIVSKDRQGFLHPDNNALNKVLQAVYDIKPKMIVFDPISSFWGSEAALNDMSRAVGKFMNRLVEESGACVEMINHMGKASSNSKDMTQFAGRGGTGLPSNARVSRVMRGIDEKEYYDLTGLDIGTNSAIMINVNKFTDGSPLYNKPFLAVREGYLFIKEEINKAQADEKTKLSDASRVYAFIKECRSSGNYPTAKSVVGYFQNIKDKVSAARIMAALNTLTFVGFEGNFLKQIEHPDSLEKDIAYVVYKDGKEI